MNTHVPTPTPFEALRIAIIRAGGQAHLARFLKVSQASVSSWDQIPVKHVIRVENEFGVPRNWLRPDIYPITLLPSDRFFGVDRGVDRVAFQTRRVSKRSAAA